MIRVHDPAEGSGVSGIEGVPFGQPRTRRKYDPRSLALPGQGLADLFPDLYARAIVCPRYPELPVARIRPRSNLILEWRCLCGATMLRPVNNATTRGVLVCDRCQSSGKSRFEFEVAALLEVGLSTVVFTHHGPRRHDQVDLYIPDYGTAVELDPYRTHRNRLAKDRHRLEHHAARYGTVFRVRDQRLPEIAGCPTVPPGADPIVWARAIAEQMAPLSWSEPTPGELRIATDLGAARYWALLQRPPRKSLADRPEIAGDFLENLDVPGQTPHWISVGSGALCLWACPNGHRPYQAPVDRRTGSQGTGCPVCGWARVAEERRRPPVAGSAADVAPELVAYFIDNLTRPGIDLTQLRPGSHDKCRWRCAQPSCTRTLHETVKGRRARPGAVCRACRPTRAWATRRANPDDPTNVCWTAALQALDDFISAHGHARIPAAHIAACGGETFPLGAWVLQTRKRRATLTPTQLNDLAARPQWVWAAKEDAWWRTFALLKQFAEREGHTRVPAKHVEGDRRLDALIDKERRRYDEGRLSADRIAALEELPGWAWRVRQRPSRAKIAPE